MIILIKFLITDIPARTIYLRLLIFLLLLIFGLITSKATRSKEKALEDFRQSQDDLALTLNSIGDAVITTNNNGIINGLNPVAADLMGVAKSETIGKPLSLIINLIEEDKQDVSINPAAEVLKSGVSYKNDSNLILISKDGSASSVALHASPIPGKDNSVNGCILVFRDVTEERTAKKELQQSERKLVRSEEKFRKIFSLSPVSIIISEVDSGIIIDANKAFAKFCEYDTNEFIGKSFN